MKRMSELDHADCAHFSVLKELWLKEDCEKYQIPYLARKRILSIDLWSDVLCFLPVVYLERGFKYESACTVRSSVFVVPIKCDTFRHSSMLRLTEPFRHLATDFRDDCLDLCKLECISLRRLLLSVLAND